jgi:hypothetical protein
MTRTSKPPRLSLDETLFVSNAVLHLVPHIPGLVTFVEPFSRSDILYRTLEVFGHECGGTYSVGFEKPKKLQVGGAWELEEEGLDYVDAIITIPPVGVAWRALSHFAGLRPTYALVPARLLGDHSFNETLKKHGTDVYPIGHAPKYMMSWQPAPELFVWVRLDVRSTGVTWHPASQGIRLKECSLAL